MLTANKDPMVLMDVSNVKLVSITGKGFATSIFDRFKKAQYYRRIYNNIEKYRFNHNWTEKNESYFESSCYLIINYKFLSGKFLYELT